MYLVWILPASAVWFVCMAQTLLRHTSVAYPHLHTHPCSHGWALLVSSSWLFSPPPSPLPVVVSPIPFTQEQVCFTQAPMFVPCPRVGRSVDRWCSRRRRHPSCPAAVLPPPSRCHRHFFSAVLPIHCHMSHGRESKHQPRAGPRPDATPRASGPVHSTANCIRHGRSNTQTHTVVHRRVRIHAYIHTYIHTYYTHARMHGSSRPPSVVCLHLPDFPRSIRCARHKSTIVPQPSPPPPPP
ncbi:hypothetical protein B0I35DRAFT_128400 [Stachybotrys elegans]|uniref:Secreted protein n=1 Tax=Stachybotrys elegans TaxID=80388 RepID=A0A8K0T483_9HYPO|nr:hypothetical protein B0I35DRAFT_128400 [Stachybotrys elegans]